MHHRAHPHLFFTKERLMYFTFPLTFLLCWNSQIVSAFVWQSVCAFHFTFILFGYRKKNLCHVGVRDDNVVAQVYDLNTQEARAGRV